MFHHSFLLNKNIILFTNLKISHIRCTQDNYLYTTSLYQKNKSAFNFLTGYEYIRSLHTPYTGVIALIPNLLRKNRVYLTVKTKDELPSLTNLFEGASFPEREAYDMLGLIFTETKDLRRILTDYGFKGHPLRKLFPAPGWVDHPVFSFHTNTLTSPGYYGY